jgi:hypothetical protein
MIKLKHQNEGGENKKKRISLNVKGHAGAKTMIIPTLYVTLSLKASLNLIE